MARRAHAYPQVLLTASDLVDGEVLAAPSGITAADALRLARRRRVRVLACGAAQHVLAEDLGRAESLGLGRVFRNRQAVGMTDDHVPLQEAGLRIIDVIDCCGGEVYPYWHTTQDTPDKVSPQALANVGKVALALVR